MSAALTLHPLFSDHAVLPRDVPLPVFGRGVPGQLIKISIDKKSVTTRVDAKGFWRGEFEPMPAGGPHVLSVSFASRQLIRRDIMIGDVWVAAGGARLAAVMPADLASDSLPVRPTGDRIRVFVMNEARATSPKFDHAGEWLEPTMQTVNRISAAAFHFCTTLEGALDCPIGIVQVLSPTGETASWMPQARPEDNGDTVFNGMIAPLTLCPVRGIIWWPEIERLGQAPLPGADITRLILAWRQAWRRERLPFLLVQAGSVAGAACRGITSWREAQLAGVQLQGTGLVVSADLPAEPGDLASTGRIVAERLALCALGIAYGRNVPSSGPRYRGHQVAGDCVRLNFSDGGAGLRARGDRGLQGFEVAGEERRFMPAQAIVEGNSVVVRAEGVSRPVAVRYAWQASPQLTLENSSGLPASPFRTDDWPTDE